MKIVNNQNKSKILSPIMWVVGLVVIAGGILMTVEMSTTGAEIAKLESDEAKLINENSTISEELAESSSLANIEKMADKLGFAKPAKTLYITETSGVALNAH